MIRLLLLCFLLLPSLGQATNTCTLIEDVCEDGPSTKLIQPYNCTDCPPQAVTRDCWKRSKRYSCTYGTPTTLCSAYDTSKCVLSTTTCKDNFDGRCVGWDAVYDCGDQSTCALDTPLPPGALLGECTANSEVCTELSADGKSCKTTDIKNYCYVYDPSEACAVSPGCVPRSTTCLSASPGTGLCTSVEDTFSCTTKTMTCGQYQTVNSCSATLAKGLNAGTVVPEKDFGEAMAALGIANELAKAASSGAVELFAGKSQKCTKGVGINSLTQPDCCKTSLTKAKAGLFGSCDDGDVELAASKRAARTHYLGDYCSEDVFLIGCVEETEGYCEFPSLMARVINEQGRLQIDALAASGFADSQTGAPAAYAYYNTANTAVWRALPAVAGQTVFARQWPAFCKTQEAYQSAIYAGTATGADCPTRLVSLLSACATSACEGQAAPPDDLMGDTSGWAIVEVDALNAAPVSITRLTVASGSCDPATEQCSYKVSAWQSPGGLAWVKTQVAFPLYTGTTDESATLSYSYQVAGFTVSPKPYGGASSGAWPATVPVDWTAENVDVPQTVNLPLTIGADNPTTLDSTGDFQAYGGCDGSTGQCLYTFMAKVAPTSMPWGSAKAPSCQGFAPDQLAILDFNKMDLSEWVNSVRPQVGTGPVAADLESKAAQDQASFFDAYRGNTTLETEVAGPSSIRVNPTEIGFVDTVAARTATVNVTRNWPQTYDTEAANTDAVTKVKVNWGDGSTKELLTLISGSYTANHVYPDAGSVNKTYTITATVTTTKSGTKTLTAKLVAVGDTPEESLGDTTSDGATSTYRPGIDPNTGVSTSDIRGVP